MELKEMREYILGWAEDESRDSKGRNFTAAKVLNIEDDIYNTETKEELKQLLRKARCMRAYNMAIQSEED